MNAQAALLVDTHKCIATYHTAASKHAPKTSMQAMPHAAAANAVLTCMLGSEMLSRNQKLTCS